MDDHLSNWIATHWSPSPSTVRPGVNVAIALVARKAKHSAYLT